MDEANRNHERKLGNGLVHFNLCSDGPARLTAFGLTEDSGWAHSGRPSPLFGVRIGEWMLHANSVDAVCEGESRSREGGDAERVTLRYKFPSVGAEVDYHTVAFPGLPLLEAWITLRNVGEAPLRTDRLDSLSIAIAPDDCDAAYFESAWGAEFAPVRQKLDDAFTLETRKGRSSGDKHPWLTLARQDGSLLTVSPAWPGNWIVRLDRQPDGGYDLSAGLSDWAFSATLEPGEAIESPPVAVVFGTDGDINSIGVPLARAGRRYWYPRIEERLALPVEWNHWFSYEDKAIDEETFKRNVDAAAELGFEICVLDAGWFGPSEREANWYEARGDWDRVNATRFPTGIRALSDYTHERGLRFGLWCEIEALGSLAELADREPSLAALRDGERCGYVCLGNPSARDWAFATLDRLIADYNCDWIKLDYNLDPGAGCNRCDHGHGAGDGLFAHFAGYFAVLRRIRDKYPHVVLENCSSGGLRIDLGIARHTHASFLSDPDWPEHSLQLFWGATTMLAPDATLRFTFSEWMGKNPPQSFDPHAAGLTAKQFDYYTRIGMLGGLAYSQRLPDLPAWMAERILTHNELYKNVVRRFVREADLYKLTAQPIRGGGGDRWAAFQYAMPDGSDHLVFVFRLTGGERTRRLRLHALEPDRIYRLEWLTGDGHTLRTAAAGNEWMDEGLMFEHLDEEDSAIVRILT